jgi:hypothetical protein
VALVGNKPYYADKRPYKGAFRKGQKARLAGVPRTACPYSDLRGYRGHVTFSRAWKSAWQEGWDNAETPPAPDVQMEMDAMASVPWAKASNAHDPMRPPCRCQNPTCQWQPHCPHAQSVAKHPELVIVACELHMPARTYEVRTVEVNPHASNAHDAVCAPQANQAV